MLIIPFQVLLVANNAVAHLLQLRALSILPDLHTLALENTPLAAKYPDKDLRVLLRNIIPGNVQGPPFPSFCCQCYLSGSQPGTCC